MAEDKSTLTPQKPCTIYCTHHLFAFSHPTHQQFNCQLPFCPKYYRTPKTPQNTYPSFNFDQKEYTSAFILGVDRKALSKNQKEEEAQYKRQIAQASQKDVEVVFPKPRKSNNRCGVCKEEFKSYFKHIMTDFKPKQELRVSARERSSTSYKIYQFESGQLQQTISKQQKGAEAETKIGEPNLKSQKSQSNTVNSIKQSESNSQPSSDKIQEQVQQDKENSDSDSVQIVQVKPAKKPKATTLNPSGSEPDFKVYSTAQKSKKNKSSEKKVKKKKSKKGKKKKSKSKSKQKKNKERLDQSDDDSDAMRRRKNSIKRRPLDPPPSNPPLIHRRMMAKTTPFRGGQRPAHPAQVRSQQVLIEKYVVQDPILDISMQKILTNLCNSISKGPPALAPRQYRRADDSNLPKSIMRSRINVPHNGHQQHSNDQQQNKQKQLSKSKDRSEGSPSQNGLPNNLMMIHPKKDRLNPKVLQLNGQARISLGKGKINIFKSILQDQKNKKNEQVIEVGGDEDSELSQTKEISKLKTSLTKEGSVNIQGKINAHDQRNLNNIRPLRGFGIPKFQRKAQFLPSQSQLRQTKVFQNQKALTFNKPLVSGVLFKKKLQSNGQIKNIGVIDLSLQQQDQVSELMRQRKGALPQSVVWGGKSDLSTIQKQSFIMSKKQ